MKFMKKLWSIALMISLVSWVSCTTEKEVILIEDLEGSSKIETRLLYRALVSEKDAMERKYINISSDDKKNSYFGKSYFDYGSQDFNIGKISEEEDENGFNKIYWEKVVTDSTIISLENKMINSNILSYRDGKLLGLDLNNGLKEKLLLSDYELNDTSYLRKINSNFLQVNNDFIVNEETGETLDISYINNRHNIFHVEDKKVYVSYGSFKYDDLNKSGANIQEGLSKELKIGYYESGIFYDIFEGLDITIESNGELGINNRVLFKDNTILFVGNINDEYGIWNYDINNKNLERILDLKSEELVFLEASSNFEKIFISIEENVLNNSNDNEETDIRDFIERMTGDVEVKLPEKRSYIANLNNNLKIENLTTLYTENLFLGFSEDGREIYFLDYLSNPRGQILEAYKI